MIKIQIDKKDGTVWDVSEIATSLSWTTTRVGSPARVEFSILNSSIYQNQRFQIENGDLVRVWKESFPVFAGYVFNMKQNEDEEISVKAYDQVRYLLNKDTYVFKNVTTGDVVRKIAADFQLQVGQIDDTGYRIPSMVEDGQTLLDIIEKANTLTMSATGRFFVFYDAFGSLCLRDVTSFEAEIYIGDESLLTGYDYTKDIDENTYNLFKLYRDNQQTGMREIYMAKDSVNLAKWGVLQLYQSVDENMNEAQMNEMLTKLSKIHNREQQTLSLSCIGDIRIRAGMYMPIVIEALGINQPMMVDEVKHRFNGREHTMSLTLKVIEDVTVD